MKMRNIVKAALFTPGHTIRHKGQKVTKWGLNMAFVGQPGTGKTRQSELWSEEFGLHSEIIISSIKDPTEFGGLAVPTGDGNLRYIPGPLISNLIKAERGVGILDEFNCGPPSVQAAELTMVQDNLAGDIQIPGGIRWIVMMNPTEVAANGHDLSPPMANRFGWIKWDPPNATDWSSWLVGLGSANNNTTLNAAEEEKRVMDCWAKPFANARGIISAFIRSNPSKLFMMPEITDTNASKAWPSPRTWEMATRALASADVHNLNEAEKEMFFSAFVGQSAANEFFTYLNKADLPDPEDVLSGKVPFKVDKRRLDRTYAIFASCTTFVLANINKGNNKNYVSKLWEMCEDALDRPDIVVGVAETLVNNGLSLKQAKSFKVVTKLFPTMKAAGITGE